MDRKAIIDGLKMTRDLCVFDPLTGEEIEPHLLNDINRATYDACKGALEILEQLDTDSDTISRQAAIDVLKQMRKDGNLIPWEGKKVFEAIRNLPSAQPEPCEDAVSRQAAKNAICDYVCAPDTNLFASHGLTTEQSQDVHSRCTGMEKSARERR